MAERRRRRHVRGSQELLSEGESQQADDLSVDSEPRSADDFVDMSEYDSAEDEMYEDNEVGKNTSDEEDQMENEEKNEDELEDEAAFEQEDKDDNDEDDDAMRESGDGKSDNDQESKLHNKVLKISEDRNSPLFIPTKGNFYQHDVRSDSGSGSRRGGRIQSDFSKERWLHDKYNEDEQTPKSREDLIEEYGYDIRSKRGRGSNTAPRRGRRPGGRRGPTRGNISNAVPRSDMGDMPEPRYYSRGRFLSRGGPIRSRNFHAKRSHTPLREDEETRKSEQADQSAGDENKMSANETQAPSTGKEPSSSKSRRKTTKPSTEEDIPQDSTTSHLHSILDVINNREQEKAGRRTRDRGYSHQRHSSKPEGELTERMKKMSLNRESVQPKRYSSQRQRGSETSAKAPRHSGGRNRPSEPPRHYPPQIPSEWRSGSTQQNDQPSDGAQDHQRPSTSEHSVSSHPAEDRNVNYPSPQAVLQQFSIPPVEAPSEPVEARMPPSMVAPPMNIPKVDSSSAPDAASLNQLQWYEAALAYQQMLSQNLLNSPSNFMPHHTPSHDRGHAIGDAPILMNTESQATSPPQLPPIPPAVGQGDMNALSSLVFPPPLPHVQNTNFIQRNILPTRPVVPPSLPMQFPPTPNLMGQEVGGVTYYPNPLQPMQNVVHGVTPDGSPVPRMNAAIPIRHPIE